MNGCFVRYERETQKNLDGKSTHSRSHCASRVGSHESIFELLDLVDHLSQGDLQSGSGPDPEVCPTRVGSNEIDTQSAKL